MPSAEHYARSSSKMTTHLVKNLSVLSCGGDAPGMDTVVRAAVRTALHHGLQSYAIYDGHQGMVDEGLSAASRICWPAIRRCEKTGSSSEMLGSRTGWPTGEKENSLSRTGHLA